MNSRFSPGSLIVVALLCGLLPGMVGCRERDASATASGQPVVLAAELKSNGLGPLPGAIYQSQAASPVHWQPWTRETLERAKAANRLVFAVVAMPQHPGYQKVLADVSSDASLVATIHESYVPVLIDGDSSREIGLLSAELCMEIQRGLQFPLFIWMTSDGNPITKLPVNSSAAADVAKIFNQAHLVVSQIQKDDQLEKKTYLTDRYAMENAARRGRIVERYRNPISQQPGGDLMLGIHRLTTLYDVNTRSFDEAGGLFPAGSIDLLATAAIHPGVPEHVRSRCRDTTRELLVDLVSSAMFDPLEGGVFSSRQGKSWALPVFQRDCVTQARVAVALIHAHRATGDARVLEKALELISFAERNFATTEGLFAVGTPYESAATAWLWSVEDVEKALPPEDAAWWIKVMGMKGLGNLPIEADPRREFFRGNSLALAKTPMQMAADSAQPAETFVRRFEAIREKLLQVRNRRIGPVVRDDCSHAGATFRMVSAYAAAYGVTGEVKFRDQAVALLEKAKLAFSAGPRLRMFSKDAPKAVGEGRAFIYGLALQAALDVSDITSDDKWLAWCEDLGATASELFTAEGFFKECSDDSKIIDVPMSDRMMLFDDSTAGLFSFAECRLTGRERLLVEVFREQASQLPVDVVKRPILHTDLLQATLAREFRVSIVTGEEVSPELKLAVERLPLRMIQRRAAKPEDGVPAGAVRVTLPGGEPTLIDSPAALREALLPSPGKS